MKAAEFKVIDKVSKVVEQAGQDWMASDEFAKVEQAVKRASTKLPEEYCIEVTLRVEVYHANRPEGGMEIMTTGLNASKGNVRYPEITGVQEERYLVDGEICELPLIYCPNCWGHWIKSCDSKCPRCNYVMGKDVKYLIDSDVCPSCSKGKVTSEKLDCDQCGKAVDPSLVSWG